MILGTTWKTFGFIVSVNLIQREDIHLTGSSEKFQ